MRPVGKALRIGRRAGAMRATGYRSTHRDGALTLERKVLHHDRAPDGPGWLVAAMVGSLAAPLIFFAAVVVWTVAKSALAGLLTGVFLSLLTAAPFVARRLLQYSRTRRAMRRGLHRPQRVRVDADGIHVDGESTVTSDRVAGLHVAERAGRYAVRARIGDGEERVLLDELDREDAALAQRELRAALRMSET